MTAALLFALLADPSYAVRDWAEGRLCELVKHRPAAGEAVRHWLAGATCPEVSFRARHVVATCDAERARRYVPSSVPVWPICDAYPVAIGPGLDLRDRRTGMAYYTALPTSSPGPHWTSYRAATEAMVRAKIRGGMTYAEADALLRRMWALELDCNSDCGPAGRAALGAWQALGWAGGYP